MADAGRHRQHPPRVRPGCNTDPPSASDPSPSVPTNPALWDRPDQPTPPARLDQCRRPQPLPRVRRHDHPTAEGWSAPVQDLLTELDILEPVTWSPPAYLADGLDLPGIDPTALDPAAVEEATSSGHNLGDVAARLGVHIDHVRLAIETLELPTATLGPTATARLTSRQRAQAIATRAFFEQHYLQDKRPLGDLNRLTGIPRRTLASLAREHGIRLRAGVDPITPDPGWLREQYLTRARTCADLARELHVTPETLRRALIRAGIARREAGVHARREMNLPLAPEHSPIVLAAAEGTLHGWKRLARFQAAAIYPSMTAAAIALGLHHTALTEQVQRLERDTAGRLYERAAYGKPQRLTPHGQALLAALDQPPTIAALRQATGPAPHPPDPATLETLSAELSTRVPARPIAPYPGLDIHPQRRSAATLAVVAYLAAHVDRDVWGYLVAKELGLGSGTVYPLLQRLHDGGWLTCHKETQGEWEARTPHRRGDSRLRHYHRLTPSGSAAAVILADDRESAGLNS